MIVVIAGPTGVGKTELSLKIAEHYRTDIISGDSMQVYKGLDIGTAKVSPADQERITHHMIDVLEPTEPFSVAFYQRQVRLLIETLKKEEKLPLIVGGTGFYIKSVLHDYEFEESARDFDFEAAHDETDNETLYEMLKELDIEAARNLHPNNRRRVLHALKRAKAGNPIGKHYKKDEKRYDYLLIVLSMKRATLYERIDARVDAMFDAGLLEEARALYDMDASYTAENAIGYKEIFGYFNGEYSLEAAKELIKRNTRRFAKRQFTYFRRQFDAVTIDVTEKTSDDLKETVISLIDQHRRKKP